MALIDLYEPLFQYICMLNRVARKSDSEAIDYTALRGVIVGLLAEIRQQGAKDPLLSLQVQKLDQPITFFVDSMIAESHLKCAREWHHNRLAYEQSELAGDEKFFDFLDETLDDPSNEATERLVIYFVCIGLGFMGWYAMQPEYLRNKMSIIAKRISGAMKSEQVKRICPEAYLYLDTRNLIEPPAARIGAILIALLVLCLVVLAANIYLFYLGSAAFRESLKEILRHDQELTVKAP